jgi:hypothetical protein
MALGVDPEKLMVREGNEGGEERGTIGEGDGAASGGSTGSVRVVEAKR